MNIGEHVLQILPEIKDNNHLRIVHLSNNLISKETKKFMFNQLMQDFAAAKIDHNKSCPVKALTNKVTKVGSSAQMKAINHQMIKKVTQSVFKTRVEMDGPQLETDNLIIMRSM